MVAPLVSIGVFPEADGSAVEKFVRVLPIQIDPCFTDSVVIVQSVNRERETESFDLQAESVPLVLFQPFAFHHVFVMKAAVDVRAEGVPAADFLSGLIAPRNSHLHHVVLARRIPADDDASKMVDDAQVDCQNEVGEVLA